VLYRCLADVVLVLHLLFILFAVLGWSAVAWRRRMMWLHLPIALWAAVIEFTGGICPLTPLEDWLRVRAGQTGLDATFVAHYILPLVYPARLTRGIQVVLGSLVLALNLVAYLWLFRRRWRRGTPVSLGNE